MFSLNRYIYLDVIGINSLYSQATGSLISELSHSKEKSNEELISGGFVALIAKLKGELRNSATYSESTKSELTAENKVCKIIEIIKSKNSNYIFEDLNSAADYCKDNNKSVFINTKTTFDMPQFISMNDTDKVNKSKYIQFCKGYKEKLGIDSYIHNDQYFKLHDIKFTMTTSLEKYLNCNGNISKLSHEACYFNNHNGENVPIKVFGQLNFLIDNYQIKPYAIWV